MELKQGYKQTEVGVIPEDWKVVHLSQLGKFKNGINKSSEAFGHGSPFVNLMDVFGVSSIASSDALGLVDSNNAEQQTYDLRKGDVIFIRSSVKPSGVGLTAVIEEDLPKTVYSGFLIRFRDSGALDNGFKRHCFYQEGFRKRVIGGSSVSANTNINQDNLKKILIAIPPSKAEQTAIAAALSDADTLIQSLAKLITKKCNIKQGAMQELLKPKESWVVKKLGAVGTFSKGQGIRKDECMNGAIPCIRYGELYTRHNDYVKQYYSFISDSVAQTAKKLKPGDILFAGSGETKEEIGKCAAFIDNTVAYAGGDIVILSPVNVDPLFLGFYLNTPLVVKQKASRGQGDAVVHISAGNLKDIEIPIPPLPEQTRIATILRDMDAEISFLETKLAKYQQIKEGMMQNLLTGRIRLV